MLNKPQNDSPTEQVGLYFLLVQDKHTPNRHCRKIPASLNVKLKHKIGIKIDGQILVIYPSEILY